MIKFPGLLLGREPKNENEESGDKKAKRQVPFNEILKSCKFKQARSWSKPALNFFLQMSYFYPLIYIAQIFCIKITRCQITNE